MVEFYRDCGTRSEEEVINSFSVVREEVEGERKVFPMAVVLDLGCERWVDGEKCIRGWLILGAKVIVMKRKTWETESHSVWLVSGWSQNQKTRKGHIMATLYIRLAIFFTTDLTWTIHGRNTACSNFFQIVNFGINKIVISKNQQTFLEGNSRELLQFS